MLLGTIGSLSAGQTASYTVTRRVGGTYDADGYVVAGATSTFPIVAVDQPYGGGRKMLPLPEGVRAEEVRLLHTATALRTRDGGGEADSISIRGETYYVWAVEGPYTLGASTHYEVYVARRARP